MEVFEYPQEFVDQIAALHRGKESWPQYRAYIEAHLAGPNSRLDEFRRFLVPEIEHHCGKLLGRDALDFGCGTGATTVALAEAGARVTGFDVDQESAGIARRRVEDHGLADRVAIWSGKTLAQFAICDFDVVLMNGVLEHVPASVPDLRRTVLRSAWAAVRPGGFLFINDTPNRLYPYDAHSTQLWWIPWTPPGSRWAYERAVRLRRHADAPTCAPGPRGLEEVGAWGITYWEIRSALEGEGARCVNLEPGHAERICYTGPRSWKRRAFDGLLHAVAVRALGAPITAFAPGIRNMVFRRGPPGEAHLQRATTGQSVSTAPTSGAAPQ